MTDTTLPAPYPRLAFVQRHPLACFFAAAFLISWAWWIPMALSGERVDVGSAGTHVPGLFGPLLAAALVTFATEGSEGVARLLFRSVSFRGRWGWFWFAALSPLVVFAVAAAVVGFPPLAALGLFGGFPAASALPMWAMLVIAAWGEEAGWRGFALPQLQRSCTPFFAAVLVAVAWMLWHVPAFFVLAAYAQMGAGTLAGFFLGILGGSFVLTWLYNRTGGSILLVTLWHGSFNLVTGTAAGRGSIAAAVSTVVMIFGFTLAALEIRARRRDARSVLG